MNIQHIWDIQGHNQIPLALLQEQAMRHNLQHYTYAEWPAKFNKEFDLSESYHSYRGDKFLYSYWELGDSSSVPQAAVWFYLGYGRAETRIATRTPGAAEPFIDQFKQKAPLYENEDPKQIPVTFWSSTSNGPRSVTRDLDVPHWSEILDNYPGTTRERLETVMKGFKPGRGGQLLLWSGDPGTGKTTALRALGNEWRSWCKMHYITDPEVFFGSDANYMLSVLTNEDDDFDTDTTNQTWRLLILEDTGELIKRDAKPSTGQGFSRLLNSVDGMIGQGLRFMILITTNEEVGQLNNAIARPGRTASKIEFDTFTPAEANDWLGAHDISSNGTGKAQTLADLFAKVENFDNQPKERVVGFRA